ncbi:palmitoyltransferase for Vac8p [Emydomyces testavorans]|uniref:Palmitoyltransferase for Vac8p n=1 Tax=Emydomyces testavorans TaxID=2070801 RepID=A0AAF0DLW2_9EURO|nr:palmitoyltransferase for Vac8p [Emydomyces testavorans]
MRGLTTIECLEKTRYLSPLRKTLDNQRRQFVTFDGHRDTGFGNTLHNYGQQLLDMHANSIPGVTREEEGEERSSPIVTSRVRNPPQVADTYDPSEHAHDYRSPAQRSLYRSYEELERNRERDRYEEYLDEQDSEKLPNAFDLGWRRNLTHLFGPNPLLWALPVCNTVGDGWHWEPSPKWLEARQRIEHQRLKRWEESQRQKQPLVRCSTKWVPDDAQQGQYPDNGQPNTRQFYDSAGETLCSPAGVSMRTLQPRSPRQRPTDDTDTDVDSEQYSTSSDEERRLQNPKLRGTPTPRGAAVRDRTRTDEWRNWD